MNEEVGFKEKTYGKLSVIMPVYNVANYVDKSVKSILKQTYKDIELIVIDDGSTDASREICQYWSLEDSRVKLIAQKNQGVGVARNAGIKVATGDYITFVDSDDWLESDAYEKLLAYLQETKAEIGVMGFTFESENDDGSPLVKETQQVLSMREAVDKMLSGKIYTWSIGDKIYRKDIMKGIMFADDIVNGEDLLFNWQTFCRANKVAYMPLWGYHYVQRCGSMTNSFSLKKLTVIKAFEQILSDDDSKIFWSKINEQYIFTIVELFGKYFSESNLDSWKLKFKELEHAQGYLRRHLLLLYKMKFNKHQKIVAILSVLPVPITMLILKIHNGIKSLKE